MPLNVQAKIDLINSDPKFSTALQVGPLPQDDFLGGVSIGADYSKYLQMRRDPHVRSVLQRRRHSILGRRVIVDVPHGSKVKGKTAQEFEARLLALKYENLCGSLLNSGQLIGFAVAQLDWAEVDGKISPSWQFVPQDRFLFAWHEPSDRSIPFCDGANHDPKKDCLLVQGYELRLLTRNNPFKGERCPKNRFLVYTFDADESPWGLGLGYSIYPWYVVKREAMKAWLLHSDRLGSPPVLGLTPEAIDEGDTEYRSLLRKFEEFLKAISPNAWARLPHGFEAKVMDLVGSAGPEVHEQLIKTANDEISKVVLGEVPFSDKATGSYAANISQVEDREASLIDADVNVLDDACHSYLWLPYAELNYPNEPVPVIRRETRADDRQAEAEKLEQEQRRARIDQDKTMQDLGYRVKPELVGEIYGQEYVDASSIQDSDADSKEPPQALASVLGARTDTLLNFLQTLSQTGYPRDNAIAVVMNVFGIPRNIAEALVPEPQEKEPKQDLAGMLGSISGEAPAEDSGSEPALPPPEEDAPADEPAPEATAEPALPPPDNAPAEPPAFSQYQFVELEPGYEFGEFDGYEPGLESRIEALRHRLALPYQRIPLEAGYEFGEFDGYLPGLQERIEVIQEKVAIAVEFEEAVRDAIASPYDFKGTVPKKTSGKTKKCTPGKSHFCQKEGGGGTCLPLTKKCGYQPPDGDVTSVSGYMADKAPAVKKSRAKKAVEPTPEPAPEVKAEPKPDVKTEPTKQAKPREIDHDAIKATIKPELHDFYDMANGLKSPDQVTLSDDDVKLAKAYMAKENNFEHPIAKRKMAQMKKEGKLTDDEALALSAWMGNSYGDMNRRMYNPDSFDDETARAVMATNVLAAKALQKLPSLTPKIGKKKSAESGTSYDPDKPLERHMKMDDPAGFVRRYQEAQANGDGTIRESTFFATSHLPSDSSGIDWVANEANVTYRVKPKLDGTGQAKYVDHFKPLLAEGEVMYPPQSRFRVTGVQAPPPFPGKLSQQAADAKELRDTAAGMEALHGSKWRSQYQKATGKKAPTAAQLKKASALVDKESVALDAARKEHTAKHGDKYVIELEEV